MRNDPDWENAKQIASAILDCYGVKRRYYLSEERDYIKLMENLAMAINNAYDNGFEAGKAKA